MPDKAAGGDAGVCVREFWRRMVWLAISFRQLPKGDSVPVLDLCHWSRIMFACRAAVSRLEQSEVDGVQKMSRDLCQDPSLSKVAGPAYPGGIYGGEDVSTTTYANASALIGISRTSIDAQYVCVCARACGL